MLVENIKISGFILSLRNSFNVKPVQILLPKNDESYSISDAFCWRSDKSFNTIFRYTDLMEYFTSIKNLNIKLVICDHNNTILISSVFKIKSLTDKIKINEIIKTSKKKSGHFFIFHELSPKIEQSILLRNSCYTSYSFKNNIHSFVHGNLPVIAENQNFIPYDKNIIQVSHLKTYDYMVQNNFERYDKVEAFLFNPTNINLEVKINDLSFTLKALNSKIINLPKASTYKVTSRCLFLRPIFFVYEGKIFDVFHG